MAFEGSLTDNSGNPINLAGVTLAFYVSAGTCYLYGESSTAAGDSQGNIIHRFGSGSPLAGSPNAFSQNLFFGNASGTTTFAGNNCSATASDTRTAQVYYAAQNITGTISLGTVPYAQNATMLSGKSVASFLQTSTDSTTLFSGGSNGQYLTKSASGLTWSNFSLSAAQVTTALGYTPSSGAASVTSSSVISALGYTPSSGVATVTSASVISALGYTPSSATASVTSASVITALGYTPANSATTSSLLAKSNNLSDLTSSATARTNLGLGALALNNFVNLGSAEVSGTLSTTRLPAFAGDVSSTAGTNLITMISIRGVSISSMTPTAGQALVYTGGYWTPTTVSGSGIGTVTNVSSANSDITVSNTTSTPVLTLNVGTGASQIIRLDSSARLPAVDASNLTNISAAQITSGTLLTARLPAFTGDVSSTAGSNSLSIVSLRGISVSSTAPTTGQVLKYNGSVWVASTDATGGGASAVTSVATGTGLTGGPITSTGTISVNFGTTSGTVAAGDDTRITGAALKTNNLSDLTSSATARTNLGLGAIALKTTINLTTDVSGVLPVTNGGSLWTLNGGNIYNTTNVAIGVSTPTARLYIASGTASLAPLKLASGTLLSAPAAGSIEYDGSYLYFTDGTNVRRALNTSAVASGTTPSSVDNASTVNSTDNITLYPQGGSVIVSSTVASTDSLTGALVVKGGMGVNGSAYFTGSLYSAGTLNVSGAITTGGAIKGSQLSTSGNIAASGTLSTGGSINASGAISTAGSITASGSINSASFVMSNGLISPYLYGSIASGGSLNIDSTNDTTKGNITIAANGGNVGIGIASPLYRLHIKSKGTGIPNVASVFSTTTGSSIIATGEDTSNNVMTYYYDSTGAQRVYLAASGTNYINNNFVIGNIYEIPGNYKMSLHGSAAISGTVALMGASPSSVPMIFSSSYTTVVASPLAGALEYDGTHLLFTNSSLQRRRLAGGAVSGTIDNINKLSYSGGAVTFEGFTTGTTAPVVINNGSNGTVGLQVNQNMVVSGSIKLAGEGLDTATSCTTGDEGKQRYNKSYKTMEFCDGNVWQGIQGPTSCPTSGGVSFTLVGKAGTGEAFCMTASHFADTTYFDAVDQCAAKTNYWGQPARVCAEEELNMACKGYSTLLEAKLPGFGSGATKYWIPAGDSVIALDFTVTTGVSCSVSSTAGSYTRASGAINSYRCCYH